MGTDWTAHKLTPKVIKIMLLSVECRQTILYSICILVINVQFFACTSIWICVWQVRWLIKSQHCCLCLCTGILLCISYDEDTTRPLSSTCIVLAARCARAPPCMQASMPACMHAGRCLHACMQVGACMQASTSCLQLFLLLLVEDFVTDSAVVYFFACIYGSCLYITT